MGDHQQTEPSFVRKIAADDFYMQVCKAFSDSDSPFGMMNCDQLIDAFRDAFSRESGSMLNSLPQRMLLSALRSFVGGETFAYERELCEILGRMYRASDGVHVNASRVLNDFGSIISARSQPSSRSQGCGMISKVELRHAISAWITDGVVDTRASASPSRKEQSSPVRSPTRATPLPPPPLISIASSPPRASPPAPPPTITTVSSVHSARHAPPLSSARVGGKSLGSLIAQLEQAAREHERVLDETSELVVSWQQRALAAEAHKNAAVEERARASRELSQLRSELQTVTRHNLALEERLEVINQRHAEALREADAQTRELSEHHRSLQSRVLALEGEVSMMGSELAAAESVNASLRDQRAALLEDLAELKREHALQIKQHQAAASEMREAAEASAAQAAVRARGEYETLRLELSGRVKVEQEAAARLRSEVHSLRADVERLLAERDEFHAMLAHQQELHVANVSRVESQISSIQSQAALELEKLKAQMAEERQHSQTLVMEAKQETARAKAETLQAREDALRWQRATSPLSRPRQAYMSP